MRILHTLFFLILLYPSGFLSRNCTGKYLQFSKTTSPVTSLSYCPYFGFLAGHENGKVLQCDRYFQTCRILDKIFHKTAVDAVSIGYNSIGQEEFVSASNQEKVSYYGMGGNLTEYLINDFRQVLLWEEYVLNCGYLKADRYFEVYRDKCVFRRLRMSQGARSVEIDGNKVHQPELFGARKVGVDVNLSRFGIYTWKNNGSFTGVPCSAMAIGGQIKEKGTHVYISKAYVLTGLESWQNQSHFDIKVNNFPTLFRLNSHSHRFGW